MLNNTDKQTLIKHVADSVIGEGYTLESPFGSRPIVYSDYTASGRALSFIEDYITDEVLPYYANTHTEASGTGLITTGLREQSREIIKQAVGANEHDALIFCGSGMTGAVNRLIGILGLTIPAELDHKYHLSDQIPVKDRPVVFIGPYEHHSNELTWRETICDVVPIGEDDKGGIDIADLGEQLQKYQDRKLKIGSFSAASNVTGICSDVDAVTTLLHENGALSFWDYAAAAPYVNINVNPQTSPAKDAVLISPHKFIGGPGTPGILIVKRKLLTNTVPAEPGGGTVAYVGPTDHRYHDDPEIREEGGTPNITGSIRAGLVFRLKAAVGDHLIEEIEEGFKQKALDSWSKNPNIDVLGNLDAPRLAIISFTIKRGDKALHHDFVVSLLNDLFGIQSRGGCSCAGPYGHRLLHIDQARSSDFEKVIIDGENGLKPGWVRVGFNYFFDEATVDYIIAAVNMIAEHGWKMLPMYSFNEKSGLWRHISAKAGNGPDLVSDDLFNADRKSKSAGIMEPLPYSHYLKEAQEIFDNSESLAAIASAQSIALSEQSEALRWFCTPEEGLVDLKAACSLQR